jgi:hypothetical protein
LAAHLLAELEEAVAVLGHELAPWQVRFCQGVSNFVRRDVELSDAQLATLRGIYDEI